MPEPYELQRLLWDLRHDDRLAEAARHDLASVLASYRLTPAERDALLHQDFQTLLDLGVSPLLAFFGAQRMGVDRDHYYAAIKGGGGRG